MSEAVQDYRPMWTELGLNLPRHDSLLAVLGQIYQDLFLSQRNRPEGMKYFDFVMSEVHGLRIQELQQARKAGGKVVGSYCVFVPEELILALDGISVGLCAGADWGTDQAERFLPRNTCALIKSFFGFALDKVCPYLASCDLVVGENTCDGKKKAYETFRTIFPRLHVIDLPQVKSPEGRALMTAEYKRFAQELEGLTGKPLTVAALHQGIDVVNRKRSAVHRLAAAAPGRPCPYFRSRCSTDQPGLLLR